MTMEPKTVLDGMEMNLCDFALFLSVMKNKEAHEITLGIIMEDPHLQLDEIRVEEVVLNKSGKRAIRLDAWAKDTKGTQYNMEMQNDVHKDDVRKRSRFYQGLMDSPILKSGKKTKYRELPSTVIIFITKEDIFGEDLAKYTFTEQCEEVEGLHLDDGTTKIFLNMTSKNGTPELVSLLQYMKETRLDNPEILVQDDKIKKLDSIVTEVKESEEWELVSMSIYSVAWERGLADGQKRGEELGLKRGEELGLKRGEELGKEIGKESKLLEIVCNMLRKGRTPVEIVDVLGENVKTIEHLCKVAEAFAPEFEFEKVIDAWIKRSR